MTPERSEGLEVPKALFSLFATCDATFSEFPAFQAGHICQSSRSLGRIKREFDQVKKELQRAAKKGERSE